jgi:hypothetical protein
MPFKAKEDQTTMNKLSLYNHLLCTGRLPVEHVNIFSTSINLRRHLFIKLNLAITHISTNLKYFQTMRSQSHLVRITTFIPTIKNSIQPTIMRLGALKHT